MRTLLLVCCGFLLIGCGGSGGGGGTTPPTDPTLAGTWTGTWGGPTPPPGDSGTLTITIESDGDITGTVHNTGRSENGTVSGSINQAGKLNFIIDYPSHDCEVYGTMQAINNEADNHWGAQSEEYNRTIHLYSFWVDLTKQG